MRLPAAIQKTSRFGRPAELARAVCGQKCPRPVSTVSLTILVICFAFRLFGQTPLSGKISGGFSAPASTDAEGRRHVVKGKEVERRGTDLLELTEPRVTRFNPDDSPDMFIESARCFYNNKAGVAYSATNLVVRTADLRLKIEGVGWNWDLSGSLLTISNHVVALVQKAALAPSSISETNKAAANPASATNIIRITSKRFEQEGDAARFFGGVTVQDGGDTVHCDRLNIQFVKPGGAQKVEAFQNVEIEQGDTKIQSGQATYELKTNLVTISDHPRWVANQREGSADLLVLNRTDDTLIARGNVYMKLPLTNLVFGTESTNAPGANRFIEILSDKFDYANARSNRLASALYTGKVRATQNDATLSCERLTANFGLSNRLSQMHAEKEVEMISPHTRVSGQDVHYDLEADKVTVEGEPRWQMEETKGRSETLVFFPKTKEMHASRHVEVIVPGHSLAGLFTMGFQTNHVPAAAQTNAALKITSDLLNRSTNISVFEKNVLVADDRGTMSCALLTIYSGQTNQAQRIVADQHVVIRQPNLQAFGERAEYEQSTGLVRLTGHPELIAPDKHLRADMFVIDRNRNTFSVSPGRYHIQLQVSKKQNPSADSQ